MNNILLINTFNYEIISQNQYDILFLSINKKRVERYILVLYKNKSIKKYYSLPLNDTNILNKYYVEKIETYCEEFESEYIYSAYYNYLNIGYIHEYKYNLEINNNDKNNINEINLLFNKYDYKKYNIDESKYLRNN